MADYDRYENEGGGGFMMGLLTGTVLGAGLGMLLAPKAGAELRGAIGEQARNLGSKASEQYRRASDSAGTWAESGPRRAASSSIAPATRSPAAPTRRAATPARAAAGNDGQHVPASNSGSTAARPTPAGGDFGRS